MGTGIGFGRAAALLVALAGSVVIGGLPAPSAGAASGAAVTAAVPPEERPAPAVRLAGTWGACGSWWTETATESSSGSVCGVDGLVTQNGQATQLAEPLISVSRYTCFKRKRDVPCTSETFEGPVRRSEMTVDPLLRRATIRGSLGGCALDVEYIGVGPAQPQGNLSEYHGGTPGSPSISVSGGQTYTSQASWWGGVCGQLVVPPPEEEQSQAWIFRGADASLTGFGEGGGGCGCEGGCAMATRPATSC
jgi:hypothetical protein